MLKTWTWCPSSLLNASHTGMPPNFCIICTPFQQYLFLTDSLSYLQSLYKPPPGTKCIITTWLQIIYMVPLSYSDFWKWICRLGYIRPQIYQPLKNFSSSHWPLTWQPTSLNLFKRNGYGIGKIKLNLQTHCLNWTNTILYGWQEIMLTWLCTGHAHLMYTGLFLP